MLNFKISVTEDYEKLVPFFIENDLEFSEEEPVPTDLVKCWQIVKISRSDEEAAGGGHAKAAGEGPETRGGKSSSGTHNAAFNRTSGKAVTDEPGADESGLDRTRFEKDEKGETEELIGAFVLAKREGEFIVDGIAIAPEYRKYRLGKALLNRGIEETLKQGGRRIYLVARAPEFFRKQGFVTVPREEAPNFFECLTCPQYGVDCHPEVMRLEL